MITRKLLGLLALSLGFSAALAAPSDANAEPPVLEPGDRGPAVQLWQDELNHWLRIARTEQGRLSEDGVYGPRTEAATRDLQRTAGITVDGVAGPSTWQALYRLLGGRAANILRGNARVTPEWPIPIPSWYWAWARWYLHRGEFADRPPRSEASRPAAAPRRIPNWGWRRLTAIVGRSDERRAQALVADRVEAIYRETVRAPSDWVRSELAPDWILVVGGLVGHDAGPVAAWLRQVRGRWVPWNLGRLPQVNTQPALVPCDLKPAFSEPSC
jgi:hypothetical protein